MLLSIFDSRVVSPATRLLLNNGILWLGPEALAEVMPTSSVRRTVFPYAFACLAGALREQGMNMGCTGVMSPWGDAVAGSA